MIAITRDVSPAIAACELTHIDRVSIDYERAVQQHHQYREALRSLGWDVIALPADRAWPDCVFIEDTAVVLEDVAVITRPGAESRRGETAAVAAALAAYRPLARIEAPGTLDGGDVLVLGDRIFVGDSDRSNDMGREQLRRITGREVIAVALHGALHLKSAITRVSGDALLVNGEWVETAPFTGWRLIDIDPGESFAANALLAGHTVIYPAGFPHTRERLEKEGIAVRTVAADELAKAEGGVTCCSLLVER